MFERILEHLGSFYPSPLPPQVLLDRFLAAVILLGVLKGWVSFPFDACDVFSPSACVGGMVSFTGFPL